MNEEILDCLVYFSDITQKTLSAFHLSNTDSSLEDDMIMINLINKNKTRKLVTARVNGDGTYTRFFSDNYTDIVSLDDIKKPSFIELSEDVKKIEKFLNKDMTPITSLRLGSKILLTEEFKEIDKPSEKMFFI